MSNNTNPPQTDGLKATCPASIVQRQAVAEGRASLTPDKRDEEIAVLREALREIAKKGRTQGYGKGALAHIAVAALTHTDKGE